MTLAFPGGDTPLPEATLTQLLDNAGQWLRIAESAMGRGKKDEFTRCMEFFDRAMLEAKSAKGT